MKNRDQTAKNNGPEIKNAVVREKNEFDSDDSLIFEDKLNIKGVLRADVITSSAWLLEIYEIAKGKLCFMHGKKQIFPHSRFFAFLYTPFSITKVCFSDVKGHLSGIAGDRSLPEQLVKSPQLFEIEFCPDKMQTKDIIKVLKNCKNSRTVLLNPNPSEISRQAKLLIDENYLYFPSIGRIARRLDVSHAHLTRQFKKDFGLTPSNYLHKLRTSDASFRLLKGEEIIDVSMDVGYNDLSRFYKQFRKNTKVSPGFCQTK